MSVCLSVCLCVYVCVCARVRCGSDREAPRLNVIFDFVRRLPGAGLLSVGALLFFCFCFVLRGQMAVTCDVDMMNAAGRTRPGRPCCSVYASRLHIFFQTLCRSSGTMGSLLRWAPQHRASEPRRQHWVHGWTRYLLRLLLLRLLCCGY